MDGKEDWLGAARMLEQKHGGFLSSSQQWS